MVLLTPASAGSDVAPGPDERRLPGEVVFTGLHDFPAYRFVIRVENPEAFEKPGGSPLRADLPPPALVREGEVVPLDPIYFQSLTAVPADTSKPITYAWLTSHAPTSAPVSRPRPTVAKASPERAMRLRFHVRQVQGRFVSLELLAADVVYLDGTEKPLDKPIPTSVVIRSLEAPPGWRLFLMPDPAWPRTDPSPPVVPCVVGEVLPSSPGPRTLVAVEGVPGPDGSLEGKPHVTWQGWFDPWYRVEVEAESRLVASQDDLEVTVVPGERLSISRERRYRDTEGRWYFDEQGKVLDSTHRARAWWWWAAGGAAGSGLLAVAAWALVKRRRTRV
jgi:hypothetical protein